MAKHYKRKVSIKQGKTIKLSMMSYFQCLNALKHRKENGGYNE